MNFKNKNKCDQFCKKDYSVEMDKVYKKNAAKYKIKYTRSKKDKDFTYTDCKKIYCNKKCDGHYNQQLQSGFQTRYTRSQVAKLKQRGAESGCSYISNYNIFH